MVALIPDEKCLVLVWNDLLGKGRTQQDFILDWWRYLHMMSTYCLTLQMSRESFTFFIR